MHLVLNYLLLTYLYTEGRIQILEPQQRRPAACCHKAQECLLLLWAEALQRLQHHQCFQLYSRSLL